MMALPLRLQPDHMVLDRLPPNSTGRPEPAPVPPRRWGSWLGRWLHEEMPGVDPTSTK